MPTLVFLGTGPGIPVAGRMCSSCVVRCGSALVLVDAGEPCSLKLAELGIAVAELDAVLLTHGHSDHTGGLPMLVQSAWLAPRTRDLPVYLPRELAGPLRQWLEAVHLPPSLLGFSLDLRAWDPARSVEVAPGVKVRIFPTTHLRSLQERLGRTSPGSFEAYGLDISCEGRRIVFSSDLGQAADLEPVLAASCDVLVCELAHFRPDELFEVLRGREIRRLVFNHLAPGLNGLEEDVLRKAREALPQIGEIRVVRDGDCVEF